MEEESLPHTDGQESVANQETAEQPASELPSNIYVGAEVSVQRSSGDIESGWRVHDIKTTPEGVMVNVKTPEVVDGQPTGYDLEKDVPLAQLAEANSTSDEGATPEISEPGGEESLEQFLQTLEPQEKQFVEFLTASISLRTTMMDTMGRTGHFQTEEGQKMASAALKFLNTVTHQFENTITLERQAQLKNDLDRLMGVRQGQ